MADQIQDRRTKQFDSYGIFVIFAAYDFMPLPAESVAECNGFPGMGDLPEYSICFAGTAGHCFVL